MESCDRALAETCYQLGLAYTFKTEYDDAVKFYKEAASIIEAKIGESRCLMFSFDASICHLTHDSVAAKLEKVVEEADKSDKGKDLASFDDPVVLAQKEIGELKDILPDIMGKIEDVTDEQKNADALKKMVKDDLAAQIGGSANSTSQGFGEASSSDAKPVSDISHLVRKKVRQAANYFIHNLEFLGVPDEIARVGNTKFLLHSLGGVSSLRHLSPWETFEIGSVKWEVGSFWVIFNGEIY